MTMRKSSRWWIIGAVVGVGCLVGGVWLARHSAATGGWIAGLGGRSGPRGEEAVLDRLRFGDADSEREHECAPEERVSRVVTGAGGEVGRVLLPPADPGWQSGGIRFSLSVDPKRTNFVTVRVWGGEANENLLFLFCDGKQIGYRPLGDYDVLCYGSLEPPAHGRFLYMGTVLPLALTEGKQRVNLEIRATGPIWPYGTTFESYQRAMTVPSRVVYEIASHTDPAWVPPRAIREAKHAAPPVRPQMKGATDGLIRQVTERLVEQGRKLMARPGERWTQMEAHFMARLFRKPWGGVRDHAAFLKAFIACTDAFVRRQQADPKLVTKEPSTWNAEWFGFGPLGDAVRILYPDLEPFLAEEVVWEDGKRLTRREAWAAFFAASVGYLRTHRRSYTNQSMIIDLNLYRSNRALTLLDAKRALPEMDALHYLYESIGLKPWLGSDDAAGKRTAPFGDRFRILSENGLSRELGYVGNYGEMLDWMAEIYQATLPMGVTTGEGSIRIREQMIKAALARAPFRYPATDAEGYRAMRIESVVGWRDLKLCESVAYGPRFGRDGSSLRVAALTGNAKLIGYAHQELADHQFDAVLANHLAAKGLRETIGLLDLPDDYAAVAGKPEMLIRLPMAEGEPDCCFFDLDDGVIALKRGEMILYLSLYWRARYGINRLAKVHQIAPGYEYRATVPCEAFFEPDGRVYHRPKTTDDGYGCPPFKEYDGIASAHEGEALPIAKIPQEAESSFKLGRWNVYAGSADGYRLDYDGRIFVMNRHPEKPLEIRLPGGKFRDFASKLIFSGTLTVPPRTCYILEDFGR